ncbi:MAG TPA: endonuclease V, partial [Streptosporangiaceae bacterium]
MLSDAAARKGLCVAVDVCYPSSGGARAAMVGSPDQGFSSVVAERVVVVAEVKPYRSGEFYLRELPAIRAVLRSSGDPGHDELVGPGQLGEAAGIALIVVDGYVELDPHGRPGLGAHVRAEFGVPVIGVAKSAFATAAHAVPVRRGASARPLFVTAAGLPALDAASIVQQMAGRFRLPDALRLVDALARGARER